MPDRDVIPMLPGLEIVGTAERSGTADVYEAVRTGSDKDAVSVAVMRLARGRLLTPTVLEQLATEAQLAVKLDHPNLVRIYEIRWHDDEPYLIGELLRGRSALDLKSGVPGSVAVALALQALSVLEYLHAFRDEDGTCGLVHRAVTPENLFLCADGRLKLLDLRRERSKLRDELALTQALSDQELDALSFVSPEQARGLPLDGRSDLFQLAATLYSLLSGRSPWGRGRPAELLRRAIKGAVPSLNGLRPDLDPRLVAVLSRALSGNREERFADAGQMLAAVQALATAATTPEWLATWAATWPSSRQQEPHAQQVGPPTVEERGGSSAQRAAKPATARQKPALLETGSKLGRYLLLDCIGRGGMGVVYAAYDPDLDRKVAIKLLHPRATGQRSLQEEQEALLQEAQALARVSHPNVVAIFDVGTFDGRVFLAMERVEGGTLRQWLRTEPRGWKEVLALFRQAGTGLLAAHRAQLVHRDFKPENVLFGADGRPRVTDFGLARRTATPDPSAAAEVGSDNASDSASFGTPAYMAPEQHHGRVLDARADQFSFCAALFEALYHQLPYDPVVLAAETPEALATLSPTFPKNSKVPPFIGRVLRRGLSPRPQDRYPGLDALLADLGRDPSLRRRRGLALLLMIGVAVFTALGVQELGKRQRRMCRGTGQALAGVWDDAMKARIKQVFLGLGESFGAETFRLTADTLDRYSRDWTTLRVDTCEATRVRHVQSDEVLTLRMLCLDHARRDLGALTAQLVRADAAVMRNAAQAAIRLPPLSDCSDVAALRSGVQLPDDRVLRDKVEVLNGQLADALAAQRVGKFQEALDRAQKVVTAARALGYYPLEAQALSVTGWTATKVGNNKQGEEDLRNSILAAIAGGDNKTEAWSYVQLYFMVGYVDNDLEAAEWIAQSAEATLERMHGDKEVQTWLLNARAGMDINRGDWGAAIQHFQQAIAAYSTLPKQRQWQLGLLFGNLSEALVPLGRYAEATHYLGRAIQLEEATLGQWHPELAYMLNVMARLLIDQRHFQEALPYAERAVALRRHGAPSHGVADSLTTLGACLTGLGKYAAAAPLLDRALELRRRVQGESHPEYALTLLRLAALHRATRRYAEALDEGRRAEAVLAAAQGSEGPGLVDALTGIGATYLALGRPAAAVPPLRRATLLADKKHLSPANCAETYFALARALWPQDPAQARAAAERARRDAQLAESALGDEIERWLRAHVREGANPSADREIRKATK